MKRKIKHPQKASSNFVPRDNPKAKSRALAADWEELLKRHSKPLFSSKPAPKKAVVKELKPLPAPVRDAGPKIQSFSSMVGSTAKPEPKVYTGTKIIGIATMHKSNMVPIFNEDAAVEVAQMRRN
jgi:hypothetical protein